jgi:hypothetical protein
MKEYICVESPNEVDGGMLVRELELIRCKDCKYWDVSKSNIMNHTCHWGYFIKKEDDYCSWAKPKEKYEKEENKGSD